MRLPLPAAIEPFRVKEGALASPPRASHGAFLLPFGRQVLQVIFSPGVDWAVTGFAGEPWEHASVCVVGERRCPTWGEMHAVKGWFWGDEETVMQLHPPKSVYRNHHPFVLHLWRPTSTPIPLPPPDAVAPADAPAAAKGGAP